MTEDYDRAIPWLVLAITLMGLAYLVWVVLW